MMMNANAIEASTNISISGGAAYRRRKKAVQFILPETPLVVAGAIAKGLTRKQAIIKVKRWLQRPTVTPAIERKAKGLMCLFVLEAEELLEAGVSYENVCALQRHWLI